MSIFKKAIAARASSSIDAQSASSTVSRRTMFAGVGAAGALAAVSAALPGKSMPAAAVPTVAAKPDSADGYQLTDHVKRYYQTAKV